MIHIPHACIRLSVSDVTEGGALGRQSTPGAFPPRPVFDDLSVRPTQPNRLIDLTRSNQYSALCIIRYWGQSYALVLRDYLIGESGHFYSRE
jgi:hypothetical protein